MMWDFLPVNLNEIKQIEVIRGPASAVWGANALYGVVNVITKSPREMQGTSATFGLGAFERANGEDSGSLWYLSGTHAQAINDRWAFKLSAGAYSQDPLSRPTGIIPVRSPGLHGARTLSGLFEHRHDAAEVRRARRLRLSRTAASCRSRAASPAPTASCTPASARSTSTSGIDDGLRQGQLHAQGPSRARSSRNMLDGDATNLLARDPLNGQPSPSRSRPRPTTSSCRTSRRFAHAARRQLRRQPAVQHASISRSRRRRDNRTEFGVYAQDEIFLSDHFRWSLGARVDRFDYLDDFVFSPRTTFLIKPQENQTIRLSYNRAYRAPSVINNFLDVTLTEPSISACSARRSRAACIRCRSSLVGNHDLTEQSLDAYEIGYTGVRGESDACCLGGVLREQDEERHPLYGSAEHADGPRPIRRRGWPLPPAVITLVTQGAGFPAAVHLPELRPDHAEGVRAGHRHAAEQIRERVRELLLPGEAGAEGLRHLAS